MPGAYGAQMITKGVFGIAQGHQNRHLVVDPRLAPCSSGSARPATLGVEPEPKATIQRFDADGSNQTTFASGIRNPPPSPSIPTPASSAPWCRSAMASATDCLPTI